ncbi:MAG: VCBS repeat-containing protein, partial [Ginsengibacter sp.]
MKKASAVTAALVSIIFSVNYSCNNNTNVSDKTNAEGEKLARVHCISCHAFPEPALLDKKTWTTGVLPMMAELMHVVKYYDPNNSSGTSGDMLSSTVQPDQLFPHETWEKIITYYSNAAPEKLPERTDTLTSIQVGMKNFYAYSFYGRFPNPVTTLVYFDTVAKKIFFGDGNAGKVFVTNSAFNITDSFFTSPGATDIHPGKVTTVVAIGSITPTDVPTGKLEIVKNGEEPTTVIGNLRRPVQATYVDLNNDGRQDIIINEFGFRQGAVSWFENTGKGNYSKHILKALPGATRTEVYDFNKDGKPDIVVLMAQGDEGVFIYYNEGNGKFKEDSVIRFPPAYGSNYFQLFDFNGDGFMDIITTNGDNADYSIILKPYHGIRIFYNNGSNQFEEKYFLPVYGAQKAIPADFDNDGDIDIVSIAFYPDFQKRPEESFIFWENSGDNTYNKYTFSGFAEGRWLTMDAGDMDGDGDQDIIIGNAFIPVGHVPQSLIEDWRSRP